jgi:hypothetical protein
MILIDTDHIAYLKYPESDRGRHTDKLKRCEIVRGRKYSNEPH